MRLGGVLAAAFGIAAVLAPSALAAKQPGALFDVQVEGRVDHDWRAGPAAPLAAAPTLRLCPGGRVRLAFQQLERLVQLLLVARLPDEEPDALRD